MLYNQRRRHMFCLFSDLFLRLSKIRVAQRKRGGPITHRSQDRNLALIDITFFCFFIDTEPIQIFSTKTTTHYIKNPV